MFLANILGSQFWHLCLSEDGLLPALASCCYPWISVWFPASQCLFNFLPSPVGIRVMFCCFCIPLLEPPLSSSSTSDISPSPMGFCELDLLLLPACVPENHCPGLYCILNHCRRDHLLSSACPRAMEAAMFQRKEPGLGVSSGCSLAKLLENWKNNLKFKT